jgi:uncharacterized LabA/DUF88 family protein
MQLPQYPLPKLGRMMVFIDGENLVARYQAMIDEGWRAGRNGVIHERDIFVWEATSVVTGLNVVIRSTYYTYIQGAPDGIMAAAERIKALNFQNYNQPGANFSQLPDRLTPCVFQKTKGRKAKGVDIQITVDILTHAYQDNCDAVYLMSGDGDYAPVIAEVQRLGKQVFVSAFSSGLSPQLRLMADRFQCLDGWYFQEAAEGKTPPGIERPNVW